MSAAFSKFRSANGPLLGWRSDSLSSFFSEVNVSSSFLAKIAGPPPLDGYAICSMDEAVVAELTTAAVIPDDGVDSNDDEEANALLRESLALLSDRCDLKELCKLARASSAFTLEDLKQGFVSCG